MNRALAGGAFLLFAVIAAVYSHPLLERAGRQIANDRYDPVLNASILWWNATTLPFSSAWWTPPHYYPSEGVAAFTENLVGLLPVSGPIYWLTGDPVLAYNLTLFLTWPLSGLACYLLVRRLTGRFDAAFVAGLVFAFAPYRASQMGHLQVLTCHWIALALFALHAYLQDGQRRWLVLFGTCWILQSWTNGYFMLFGGVLLALWIAYFCTEASARPRVPALALAWVAASVPLLPVLLRYRAVHGAFGLERPYSAVVDFSAPAAGWWSVTNLVALWSTRLRDIGGEWNLFPGLTCVLIVAAAIILGIVRPADTRTGRPTVQSLATLGAGIVAVACLAAVATTVVTGPWRVNLAGLRIRMSTVGTAVVVGTIAGALWIALHTRARHAVQHRSPLVFYSAATLLIIVFSMGPEIRVDRRVVVEQAPYAWLMWLPGFSGLRVPPRFWMLGILCLATATGIAYARLSRGRLAVRAAMCVVTAGAVLAESWIREMPMAAAPAGWETVEPAGREAGVLELPLGPEYDAAATFRAVRHRRRVVNGVSGYDPPHYAPLQRALAARDPSLLPALATLGPLDVVVDTAADPDGAWMSYVSSTPGVRRMLDDGTRVVFALAGARQDPCTGPLLSRHEAEAPGPGVVTNWGASIDLGQPRSVGCVVIAPSGHPESIGTRAAVELSNDGGTWRPAWQGSTFGAIVVGMMRAPREAEVRLPLDASPARYVRLRLTDQTTARPIAHVRIHAPGQAPTR